MSRNIPTKSARILTGNRTSVDLRVLQIARGLSAAIGAEFFVSIAQHLAEVLEADCVYLGEFLGGPTERVRTLGACIEQHPDSFEYELAGSASAQSALGKPCLCRSRAQERFPEDQVFRKLGVEACVGVPMLSTGGHPMGVMMAVYRKPIPSAEAPKAVLETFAPRAAAELERRQQEEQLSQSEQRHRAFIDLNDDGMWRVEFEPPISVALPELEQLERIYECGYLAECNDAMAQLLGLQKAEELIGCALNRIAPLSNPSVRDATLHAIRSGYRFSTVETEPPVPDGSGRYVLRSQWGIVDHGMLRRIWGSSRDITELRRSEMALHASEQSMTALLDELPLLVVTLHPDGEIAFCNSHLFSSTGWRPTEIAGRNWVELMIPASERVRVRVLLESARTGSGTPVHFESPLLGPRGDTRWIAWDSTSVTDSDGQGRGTINVGRDITAFKDLQAKFYQAQKLETIGRLAGGLADDFNGLLTLILSHCGAVLEHWNSAGPDPAGLAEIRRAAEKGIGLTQQLFAFSQRRAPRSEILNLTGLIADDAPMIRQIIGNHVQLVTHLEPSLTPVLADVGHVHQIVLNLVVNARDAMPGGGTLTVSTSNLEVGGSAPAISGIPAGSYVQLSVSDTGTGMTGEVRSHLFEPFYTTKARGQGTGLGLPTVYGIVQQSGGHILVETSPGVGTSFRILLPACGGPAANARAGEHQFRDRRLEV